MIKMELESNESATHDFIEKLKNNPLLEGKDITIFNANDYALYLAEYENCLHCKGLKDCKNDTEGYKTVLDGDSFLLSTCKYKKEQLKKEKEENHIHTLFVSKSILNAQLENLNVDTPNRKKIYEYIIKFMKSAKEKNFMKGLYLYGDFSTGKTFILGCIANELARNNIQSLIIYFPDLVVELKNAIATPRYEELMNYLKSVDVLLLDDLGSENLTNWLRDDVLGPVLNYRLMEEKPIFISSNLDPKTDDLLAHLSVTKSASDVLKGTRIKSRLEGLVVPIELDNLKYKR
ncbi:MAG: ATP-binding protein [Anaeroplasmataceae bacterium]|nr:ATP-binding protein [Anaeroplasmataceae bacterium]